MFMASWLKKFSVSLEKRRVAKCHCSLKWSSSEWQATVRSLQMRAQRRKRNKKHLTKQPTKVWAGDTFGPKADAVLWTNQGRGCMGWQLPTAPAGPGLTRPSPPPALSLHCRHQAGPQGQRALISQTPASGAAIGPCSSLVPSSQIITYS